MRWGGGWIIWRRWKQVRFEKGLLELSEPLCLDYFGLEFEVVHFFSFAICMKETSCVIRVPCDPSCSERGKLWLWCMYSFNVACDNKMGPDSLERNFDS